MDTTLQNRFVLLTGATGGLGGAVTKELLARGAVVTAPTIEDPHPLLDRLPEQWHDRLRFVDGDLVDEPTVERIVKGMTQVDALVHLVGGFTMGDADGIELDAWRAHHDLQLTTTMLCCKHALRRMKEAGYGRIVTVGSKAVAQPMAKMATYAAAKAGVVALTQTIAEETKGTGITANSVLPSIIDTPANREAMGDAEADAWVSPESLAQTIAFLASPAAADVRGAAIPVYGDV